jgi:hypothetical protein
LKNISTLEKYEGKKMKTLEEYYTSEIYAKALHILLRSKEYHLAPPSRKDQLIMQECARIHCAMLAASKQVIDADGR